MKAVVVGIGQAMAGDDGVGLVVARALKAMGIPAREASDASILLELFERQERVILIDAVVCSAAPGTVMQLDEHALATGAAPISSHGIGVADAIALGRSLYGDAAVARLTLIGIAIARPTTLSLHLTEPVARAVDEVVRLTQTLMDAA